MKLKVQLSSYLLNIGRERIKFENHGRGQWVLFFGVGSLGHWPWMHGFDFGIINK